MNLDWGPDARPKIAIDRQGRIALAFSTFKDKAFNGQVLTTRSEDAEELCGSAADHHQQREPAL